MIYQQVAVQSIGRYGRYGRYGRWARRSDRSGATDICGLEVCRNAIEGTGQSLWPKAQEMMEMSLRLMGLGTECSGCVGLSLKTDGDLINGKFKDFLRNLEETSLES